MTKEQTPDLNKNFAFIQNAISNNKIVLFMKGTADLPQCGYSSMVVAILRNLKVEFMDINVLSDPGLREGIKIFTKWPTIPQLYINGEFVGGCDIVREMYQNGELAALLTKDNSKK